MKLHRASLPCAAVMVAILPPALRAQTETACPTMTASAPATVREGAPLTVTANVSGGDPRVTPTFNWSISAGKISAGQGTSSITLDSQGLRGQFITATVDVGGYPRQCSGSTSVSTSVATPAPALKFGEYVAANLDANTAQLAEFVRALQKDPSLQGYIIGYGGRKGKPGDGQKVADSATAYTMNTLKIDGSRTLSGDGGYREQPTVEMWIAPADGDPPLATPTVDPKEIKPT